MTFLKAVSSKFFSSYRSLIVMGAVLCGVAPVFAQTSTNIQVTSTGQQLSVKRLGVNLGDQTYYDSGQLLKNLIFQNPGFEPMKYRSIMICSVVSGNTCTDDNNYSPQPTGFWTGGTYTVISGNGAGETGTVVSSTKNPSSCSGCGQIIQFDKTLSVAVGDYFVVQNAFTGSGDAGWWDNTSGGGTITSETTDLSSETLGQQAISLNAKASGQSVLLTQYFDGEEGLSFIQLNGSFTVSFRAKGIGGTNQLNVSVARMATTPLNYMNQTQQLTNTWQDYTMTFSANETGSAVGTVQLVFAAKGASVELDDVSLVQSNSSASNTSPFRDDVVNALKQLNPGTIRMMAAGAALGSDVPNQLQPAFARYREGFSTGQSSEGNVAYGIHEFLQLCQATGADPWITIPTATNAAEMTDLIEYLTGTGSDQWSELRISRGQSAPWTSVFNKIHLELGNETWNGQFRGEAMNYDAYPYWANTVFGAARAVSGFKASKFDLILDGFAASSGYNGVLLSRSTQHDSIDIAPYLLYSANNEPQATMFGALFAEPEIFDSTGGEVANDVAVANTAPTATYVNVYETNLSPVQGTVTETQLNALTPSMGAGIAHADHMLQMMRAGVVYQNAFSLPQFNFKRNDGNLVKLWGTVVDMGTTNRRRPQFQTQSMANSVIAGNMIQTVQTGANPTWNQPLSSDNVQLNGAHYLQSFAFQNGTTMSAVVFNLNLTSALPVTFSGTNAPTGAVALQQITSANITDNNETASVIAPTTQSLSNFNASTTLSLPPFSMTTLTWTTAGTQAPYMTLPGGAYTAYQTVGILDLTPGAVIHYTTDGSTPTASSPTYTAPFQVAGVETVSAIAIASGMPASPVTSVSYSAIIPVAATPVFSVASGIFTAKQLVTISDATAGVAIYFTVDGSIPTTASVKYTGTITVGNSETLNAIAVVPLYVNSLVGSASYTINGAAATPAFSVAAGTYIANQTVAITDTTPGAVIYYTLNGSVPTTASTVYSGPITVSSNETVEALAVAVNYLTSAVGKAAYVITPPVATPVMSVAAGSYVTVQTVTLTDATAGSTIYYTLNGSVPTTSSTRYSSAITVGATETINAIAVATGDSISKTATAAYTITLPTATPVYSLAAGSYTGVQTLTISDATTGSTIYYTTDGTTPTPASNKYLSAITMPTSETLKAIATAPAYSTSPVATAVYTVNTTVATPVLSLAGGTYATSQSVTISEKNPGASVYFTTNGTTPTTASTHYTGAPIVLAASQTVQAIAMQTAYTNSAVASAAYVISSATANPVISLASGNYTSAQKVTITDATAGATIYYTTNGTLPNTSSSIYTSAITVSSSETLETLAMSSSKSTSSPITATYTINASTVATPAISLATGSYTGTQSVTISDATSGAAIYYTTNGTTPTTSSTKYAGAISVTASETVEAIAVATGYANSTVASAAYTITAPAAATPVISLATGSYTGTQSVTMTDATSGAAIYYTTNGTAPTTASAKYAGAITVSASETVEAIAVATGYTNSTVASAAYAIVAPAAATPAFSVAAGNYTSAQTVAITSSTAGATIYYTVDGSTPTTASTKYSSAITVSATETVEAIAVVTGYTNSTVASAAYTITAAGTAPVFGTGFTSTNMTMNGSAVITGGKLELTNGGAAEMGSAWYGTKVSVSEFTTDFDFQLPTSTADGFTFTIQNGTSGVWSVGANGSGLGYQGIKNSFALAFNLYQSGVANAESIGIYTGGVSPQGTAAQTLVGTGANLHSGDTFHIHLVYANKVLTVTLTDKVTGYVGTLPFNVDIPTAVGASTAYAGFTGGTGKYTATQNILDWTFSN